MVELGQNTSPLLVKVVDNKKVEVKADGCAEPNHLQEGREVERIEDERAC